MQTFKAYNKTHGISTDKINSSQCMETLLSWKMNLEGDLILIKNRISILKLSLSEEIDDAREKYEAAIRYKRVQSGLLRQIVHRYTELKKTQKGQNQLHHIAMTERQLSFWKDKVKELNPECYFIFCKELDVILGKTNKQTKN